MKKDPICGTYIPENQAVISEINGTIHYFCSEECKLKFQELPK
ncbi:MAG: YHS domain-containing protein [Acidobacteria bacterium]|nr:YHS domain-containing protein [Acidobacteriota bacterium]